MQPIGQRFRIDIDIDIDIGGTISVFVLLVESADRIRLVKSLTAPGRLTAGVGAGLDALGMDLRDARMVAHGATVGLNSLTPGWRKARSGTGPARG